MAPIGPAHSLSAGLYARAGKDLSGGMTSGIDFAQTIEGATLARADIEALSGAGGRAVHLVDCDLDEAELAGLDLAGWRFERCSLRRADMSKTRLERSQWLSCRGPFTAFFNADLTDATLRSCDFNNGNFRHARLTSTRLTGCKLTGADLSEARVIDIAWEEVLLSGAKLAGLDLRKHHLRRLDFGQADLRKADLREVVFEACSLRDAMLAGARFDRADLRGADLGGLRLVDAGLFRGATISREQAAQLLAELGLKLG
jgi:fluoroquinolone resistance protein